MVAPQTDNAVGIDIVCSAWKHAAVMISRGHYGVSLTNLSEQKV